MDLVTLALALKNGGGGGGGAGAPLIVPGELTTIDGRAAVEIETDLADIYAAAVAGRAVLLEWNDDGDATRLLLVTREYDDGAYSLTFGSALFVNDMPAIISVSFNNETEGFLDVELMTDAKYDIEIVYEAQYDLWEASEFDIDALNALEMPVRVRAVKVYGDQENYFVWKVIRGSILVEVILINMDPDADAADQVIQLEVYPDGRVIRR